MVHYKNGLFHKEDGCAVILTNGDKEWWINGNKIPSSSDEDFMRWMRCKSFW